MTAMTTMSTMVLALQSGSEFESSGGGGIFAALFSLVWLAMMVVVVAGAWKVFVKAGEPGWACLVPIYNMIVILKIVNRPIWWFLLLFIPVVGLVVAVIIAVDLAKAFGKGVGFAIGMICLPFIFYPILGFGDAEFQG